MDTSDAFRQLAQSGLGGAGGSGREAQDAIANLTRLGMSASEAASFITSFGRASAILGKANFSKFVSGIASAGTFAADLGLTLDEAAEYAAEEIDIRQRAMAGQLQLDSMESKAISASIRETQRFASVMGLSMKDINATKKEFLDNNANINNLMMKTAEGRRQGLLNEISATIGASAALGDQGKTLFQSLVNSAALQIPIQDSNLQNLLDLGTSGSKLYQLALDMNRAMYEQGKLPKQFVLQFQEILKNLTPAELGLIGLEVSNNEMARILQNAQMGVFQAGNRLKDAINGVGDINDPMVTAAANFQNVMKQVTGAFTTVRNNLISELAPGINEFFRAFMDSRSNADIAFDSEVKRINENKELSDDQKKAAIAEIKEKRKLAKEARDAEIKAIKEDKELSEEEKERRIKAIKDQEKGETVLGALNAALTDIAKTIVKVFFGDIAGSGKEMGEVLRDKLIPWIKETAESVKNWFEQIKGDTFGEKIKNFAKKLFEDALPGIIYVLKETTKAVISGLFSSPTVVGALVDAIGLLFLGTVAKSAISAGISSLFAWITGQGAAAAAATAATTAATTGAGAATGAGLLAATGGAYAATRAAGGGRLAAAGQAMRAIPAAGLAGRALTGASVVGAGLMVGKDAFDVGRSLATGESVKGADIGGVAGGVLGGVAGAFLGGPVGAALGASLGNMAGEWVGSFFDKDEAVQQGQEVAKQTAEQLKQQQGLAAMAMDPEHIRAVAASLKDFNAVSIANITQGLQVFNPILGALFDVINKVKVQFVDIVNNRLGKFLSIVKGLNEQGVILPKTTEYINNLATMIATVKVDPILKLSTAFDALANALKNFSDLTTNTIVDRAFDWLTGKQDTTENVIKVLNNFASKVDAEKLQKAADATQAFNNAMQGLLGPATVTDKTTVDQAAKPATTTTTTPATNPQMDKQDEMVRLLKDIKILFNEQRAYLSKIAGHTDPQNPNK